MAITRASSRCLSVCQDFLSFLDDLKTGIFIQHTVESMLFDTDGKQLMSEAIYLYGVTLMVRTRGLTRGPRLAPSAAPTS